MKQLNYQLFVEIVIFSLWVIRELYKNISKQGFADTVHIENEVKKQGDERCKQIAEQFGADRVVYWAISNGEEFINGWSKKKLVALCEWYKPSAGLKSFRDAFLEVSTLRFDRNLKALLDSDALFEQSTLERMTISLGKEQASISVYNGAIYVEDEAGFEDGVSEVNMLYGFRSIAACKAYNKNGKLQGFLVLGWQNVKPEQEVNIRLFQDQGRTFYKVIDQVMSKYRLTSKILNKLF